MKRPVAHRASLFRRLSPSFRWSESCEDLGGTRPNSSSCSNTFLIAHHSRSSNASATCRAHLSSVHSNEKDTSDGTVKGNEPVLPRHSSYRKSVWVWPANHAGTLTSGRVRSTQSARRYTPLYRRCPTDWRKRTVMTDTVRRHREQ